MYALEMILACMVVFRFQGWFVCFLCSACVWNEVCFACSGVNDGANTWDSLSN